MNWDARDFVAFGVLVAGFVFALRFAFRRSDDRAYRWGTLISVGGAFLLLWSNAAVGIIGAANNDINLLYLGVPATGLLLAFALRFRAAGLVKAMLAMTLVQLLVPVVAVAMQDPSAGRRDTWMMTLIFGAIWLTSAALFRASARHPDS